MKIPAPSHRAGCRLPALLSLALVLAACAPLLQAPLVYTSGVTVGVKVGVSPAQADAFETVIGFKMLDAAYVPVAVSKPDIDGPESSKAKVHEIYGQFGEEITPEAVRQLNPGEIESVKSYLGASANAADRKRDQDTATRRHNTAITVRDLAAKADEDAKKKVEEARTAILGLRNLGVGGCDFTDASLGLGTSGAGDWSKVNKDKVSESVETCLKALEKNPPDANTDVLKTAQQLLANGALALKLPKSPSSDLIAAQTKEGNAKRTLDEASDKLKKAQADLDDKEKSAMEALQKLANIRKRDALSVYGSFNGSLDQGIANKGPTIGSKLGKVFSTGVAAQNLTEAAKISATADAFSQCVANLKDLAGVLAEDKREGFIKQAIENCGNGVKNTTADKKNS